MSQLSPPGEPHGLSAPRLHRAEEAGQSPEFLPLRLLLQPGGLCVELTQPNTLVGRHSEADVRLGLPDVSRRHCRFLFARGAWQLIDLNSLNGTYVNEHRLPETTLTHGDRVRIGSLTFLVEIAEKPAAPRPAEEAHAGVLKSIADVLPGPSPEKRKAS
jgi:predicted component of type VI protein secretion system